MQSTLLLTAILVTFALAFPSIDTENTLDLQIRTDLSTKCATVCRMCTDGTDMWDCCACGNCCKKL